MKYSSSLSNLSPEPFDVLPFPRTLHRNASEVRGFGNRKPEKYS